MSTQPVFVLGAGGHTKVLLDAMRQSSSIRILGLLEADPNLHGKMLLGYPILDERDRLAYDASQSVKLINGIGSIRSTEKRKNIFLYWKKHGFNFATVIHPMAYIGIAVTLGEGAQIMAGSLIQPRCFFEDNVIINTRATLDHDCHVESHVHVATGTVCCGGVVIGEGTHVGAGAIILQGVHIGKNCLIASGAVVTKAIADDSQVAGIPAKSMKVEANNGC